MKKLLCFWICLCLGFLGEVQAQAIWAKDFPFAGGLPTNEMTTIYQDRDGFIWVGTTNGLVRYDGYHVRLFQRDGSLVSGLTDNRITQMAEDSLYLWVGTSAGLNLINRNTYQVSAFPEESLGKGYINSLCSDGENTVWVGTDNQVLVFRAPSLHPVDTITLASREGKRAVINKVLRDRTGRLWICTRAGLFLHEPSTNRLCHLPPVGESDNLSSVCQDRDGRLWVASWGEGLWQIVADRNFRDVRYVFHPVESFQKGAGESRFFDVEQDDVCGYLWALSYDRLYAFRITPAGTLEQVELPFYVDVEKMYTCILKDRDGNLWLSSYDRGTLLTFHGETVRDVSLSGFVEALGKRPNLLTLTVDGRGRFWFVQDRFGLCLHNPSDGSTVLASQDVRRVTVDVRVVAESPSEDGLWVASPYGSAVYLLTCDGGRFRVARTLDLWPLLHIGAPASRMAETPDGNLWMLCRQRVVCLAREKNAFATPDSLRFTAMQADGDGKVWAATGEKLYLLSHTAEGIRFVPQPVAFPDVRDGETVRFLAPDGEGGMWVSTDMGNVWHRAKGQVAFTDVSNRFDLRGTAILNLLSGKECLWVVAHDRILYHDNRTGRLRQFSPVEAGLETDLFRNQASCLSPGGSLYAGGHGGIAVIHFSGGLFSGQPVRRPLLSDFGSGGRSLLFDPSEEYVSGCPDRAHVTLRPDAGNLYASFTTLDYARDATVRYACRMEGVDRDWVVLPEGENTVYYQNLPKGTRRLEVKATDGAGKWQQPMALLWVTRLPAWYETSWAYAGYVFAVAGMLFVLLRFWFGRLKAMNDLRLQEELTRAKTDYFTNVSHELLTPLSVISCVGDYWEGHYPAEEGQVRVLRRNIGRLKRLLRQVLDFRKAEGGHLEFRPAYGDILAFARRMVADNFAPLAAQKGIVLRQHVPDGTCGGALDFDKVDMMLYNLLSNAVKYTPAGKAVDFIVEMRRDDAGRRVVFTVRDEGPGIPQKEQSRVFERFYTGSNGRPGMSNGIGLALSRELAVLCGGRITLESAPGKGSCFTLELPVEGEDCRVLAAELGSMQAEEEQEGVCSSEGQADEGRSAILLVDDNAELLGLMAKVLSGRYRVATARDGQEALDFLSVHGADLVVSDVMMPVMDGYALCRQVKSQVETGHIPVIMLTAMQGEDDRVRCYEAGADGYLAKPFGMDVLVARIDNLVKAQKARQRTFRAEDHVRLEELAYSSRETRFLEDMAGWVRVHLSEEGFGVEQLAEGLHMSKATLHRKVKSMTGLTPLEFIRNIKLKYACAMLSRPGASVSAVAYDTGFSDPKYFTKCFKEEFGMTPTEYRQHRQTVSPETDSGGEARG